MEWCGVVYGRLAGCPHLAAETRMKIMRRTGGGLPLRPLHPPPAGCTRRREAHGQQPPAAEHGGGGRLGERVQKKEKRHKHKLSEVRADFLDLRRGPHGRRLRRRPRRAPRAGEGGATPVQEIRADLRRLIFMAFFLLGRSAEAGGDRRRPDLRRPDSFNTDVFIFIVLQGPLDAGRSHFGSSRFGSGGPSGSGRPGTFASFSYVPVLLLLHFCVLPISCNGRYEHASGRDASWSSSRARRSPPLVQPAPYWGGRAG